jgi:arginase
MDGSDNRKGQTSVLSVIGAPVEDGASVPGTIMGPAALRTAGLIRTLRDLGHEVDDRGDLSLPDGICAPVPIAGSLRNLAGVACWSRLLCRETYTAVKSGRVPIVIGGDHSLSIGSVSGIARYCAEVGRELFRSTAANASCCIFAGSTLSICACSTSSELRRCCGGS